MNSKKLASGDNKTITQSTEKKTIKSHEIYPGTTDTNNPKEEAEEEENVDQEAISPKTIDEKEIILKERVAQCKNIIESLKLELKEEKNKLEQEAKDIQLYTSTKESPRSHSSNNTNTYEKETEFVDQYNLNMYSASVGRKLNCDENLMEYEKQLQRYQNTLNMAQLEKKNAIRKQMLAKAFKLKLMEVENQCNIELIRIKQSLQCLEPLQMIVEKWKVSGDDNVYDLNNFQLIPRYPELSKSGSDITNTSGPDDLENNIASSNPFAKHE